MFYFIFYRYNIIFISSIQFFFKNFILIFKYSTVIAREITQVPMEQ